MKFGPIAVGDAEGTILAHAFSLPDERFKKGRLLSKEDVVKLQQAGIEEVIVARLEDGDVEENEAARRISVALLTHNISSAEPFTGRVNLYAKCSGVFFSSKQGVDDINRIAPAITLATLPNGAFVEAGRMVATVKIIPFAEEEKAVQAAEMIAKGAGILTVRRSLPKHVALISTQLPTLKKSTMDKTARVLAKRLEPSGSTLGDEVRIPHTTEAVASALANVPAQCDMIILFGASAITDRMDVIPSGLEMAGGRVETFGMPVDPGNLLMTGYLHAMPVIGAPGCARSPAENGFDWVLQRLLAGLSVDQEYISGLGVGGLLMEINSRPQLRDG